MTGTPVSSKQKLFFKCAYSPYSTLMNLVCDGFPQCPDGSDEGPLLCTSERCKMDAKATVHCMHKQTGNPICQIPCDGISWCLNEEDETCTNNPILVVSLVPLVFLFLVLQARLCLKYVLQALATRSKASTEFGSRNIAFSCFRKLEHFVHELFIRAESKMKLNENSAKKSNRELWKMFFEINTKLEGSENIHFYQLMYVLILSHPNSLMVKKSLIHIDQWKTIQKGNNLKKDIWFAEMVNNNHELKSLIDSGFNTGGLKQISLLNLVTNWIASRKILMYAKFYLYTILHYTDFLKDITFFYILLNQASVPMLSFGGQIILVAGMTVVLPIIASCKTFIPTLATL